MPSGICDGRVVLITGAGQGIGRGYALEFARQGARVVVNDYGGARDGSAKGLSRLASSQVAAQTLAPADAVVAEIKALGGEAVANYGDAASWADGEAMVKQAVAAFGGLDAVVCNAGILRDRTLANMTEADWDAVVAVNMKGTFVPAHFAARHWRERCKETGAATSGRLVVTTSAAGLFANPGQTNYAPAKAAVAMFAVTAAKELARYGVTVNAIAPAALTRLTVDVVPKGMKESPAMNADNIAPLVVWLCSPLAGDVTGQIFGAQGGKVTLYDTFRTRDTAAKKGRWDPAELTDVIPAMVRKAPVPEAHKGAGGKMPKVASGKLAKL